MSWKYIIWLLPLLTSGCGPYNDSEGEYINPEMQNISADIVLNAVGRETIIFGVQQVYVIQNNDINTFNVKYVKINNRDECIFRPVMTQGGRITRFDIHNKINENERISDSPVMMRTGDQVAIGKMNLFTDSHFHREICGSLAYLSIYTTEGIVNIKYFGPEI